MRLVQLTVCATVLTLLPATAVRAQTQNTVPKYGTGGALVNSSIVEVSGNVGIGVTSPGQKLDVNGDSRLQGIVYVGGGSGAGILTYNSANFYVGAQSGRALQLGSDGALSGRLVVTTTGNIGIGTETPGAKLHVAGNVIVDGNIGAKYQDVAEWVETSAPAEPGSVVVADIDRTNHVRPSAQAYDTAVAGVVSAQPGVLLGEAGEGKVAVAQSGRVRVKVDASFGAVKAGDLLVTSPNPGYAMRSQPVDVGGIFLHRPGTILGKALESLASGTGEVLTLITLQ